MDEEKTLESKNLSTNGEGSANLVVNENVEARIEETQTDTNNTPNGNDIFSGSEPERNTSIAQEAHIKQTIGTEPEPDRTGQDQASSLDPSETTQHESEQDPTGQDQASTLDPSKTSPPEPKPDPTSQDQSSSLDPSKTSQPEPDTTGQDQPSSLNPSETSQPKPEHEPDSKNPVKDVGEHGNEEKPLAQELHSEVTNGEICNHKEGSNKVSGKPLERAGSENLIPKPTLRKEGSNEVSGKQLEKAGSETLLPKPTFKKADIDTTAPFESVKAAVSMFGGIIDWKAHKIQMAERRIYITRELRKAREEVPLFKKKSEAAEEEKEKVVKELENTKRLIEELKLNLERAQTEERQAKQDAELAKLRVEEMEQGVADDSSVAARAQLEVAHARHQAAVDELKSVQCELEDMKRDYELLVSEKDVAIKNANEAVVYSKEIEKEVERLTIKMITTKEAMESAHAAHLEAEEHRIAEAMERDQDVVKWEKELKKSLEEFEKINQQIASTEDLKSKLDTASGLLQYLKGELAAYMGENVSHDSKTNGNTHKDIQAAIDVAKTNLEEVKKKIEKATDEVNSLKLVASSLNSELEQEKATLFSIKQRQEMASLETASLEADLDRTISEVAIIQKKEKEAREKTVELPKQLQQAEEEVEYAKSRARKAHEELEKAKKAAEEAKAGANAMTNKLLAAQKEIEATRTSENLALNAISALEESESTSSNEKIETESGVTLSLEEYYKLSRKAQEAEDQANTRVSEAMSQIDVAKESELKAINKLEQMNSDLALKKDQLTTAMQKAEKAKEGKLAVEQELRVWRSENEQRRKAKEDAGGHKGTSHGLSPKGISGSSKEPKSSDQKPDIKLESNNSVTGSSRDVKPRKKKRRSLIPRIIMFFKRKGHSSSKRNTNTNTNTNTSIS